MTMRQRALGLAALALSLTLALLGYRLLLGLDLSAQVGGRELRLAAPEMLCLLGVLPLLVWAAAASLSDMALPQRLLSLLTRSAVLGLIALAAAGPSRSEDATRVSTVVLLDVSDSIADSDLASARRYLTDVLQAQGEEELHLVTFGARPRSLARSAFEADAGALTRHSAEGSDLQAALQLAYGLFGEGALRRVLLMSDGVQTGGDVAAEVERAREFSVRIHTRALTAGRPAELAVRGLQLPETIQVGESFQVQATLFASRAGKARLRLYQGEVLNGLDAVRTLELPAGETTVQFPSVVRAAGPVRYRLVLTPQSADRFEANNVAVLSALVPGRPRVLLVDPKPVQVSALARALATGDYDVDVRAPRAMPRSLAELDTFDFFILSDVPADRVTLEQMEVIERYVRDLGGGFMMAGGEDAFGLGGYHGTRMERLLPVRMDSERRRDEHSLALALVIDSSGSMSGQKIELAKEAAKATAQLLGPDDSLGVVGFSGRPERLVRLQTARNRRKINYQISRLSAQGGTAIFPALDMAFQDLVVARARIKHIILLTDGQTQEQGIAELVESMRAENITVSTVGLGSDVNRSLLQEAASLGGGRAYFTNDPHNIPRIFMRETTTVGRSGAVEDLVQAHLVERADFLKGLEPSRAPFLRGYVATQAKARPAQVILRSDLDEPLLARWRVGLGWSLAWTSDVKARWSADWLRWPAFPRFWNQLIREHMRRRSHRELPMSARIEDDRVRVSVDALGGDDEFLNGLQSTVTLQGPLGASGNSDHQQEAPLQQVAPGYYEAELSLEGYGTFVLSARHLRNDRLLAVSRGRIARSYPREYALADPDPGLLAELSAATGGMVNPSPDQLFDPLGEHVSRWQGLWPPLLGLSLALFLLDLFLRRVRLFDRNFIGRRRHGG